jgi:hypothetical protein
MPSHLHNNAYISVSPDRPHLRSSSLLPSWETLHKVTVFTFSLPNPFLFNYCTISTVGSWGVTCDSFGT